jgi:septal ring factor EnvC (AmiA/AmiB activator)
MSQDQDDGQRTLEGAAEALRAAERSVREARRRLSAAIVAAYRSGESVPVIASRTGEEAYQVRNLLAAAGVSRRS